MEIKPKTFRLAARYPDRLVHAHVHARMHTHMRAHTQMFTDYVVLSYLSTLHPSQVSEVVYHTSNKPYSRLTRPYRSYRTNDHSS